MLIGSFRGRAGGKKSNQDIVVTLFMLLSSQGARFERERPLGLPPSPDLRPQVGRDFQRALAEPLHEQVAHLLGV